MGQPEAADEHHLAVRRDYDRRADEWRTIYAGQSFHDHTIRRRLEITLGLVDGHGAGTGEALDVGCGAGQLLVELGRRGYAVSGCDVAPAMVTTSREALARAGLDGTVTEADATRLPFEDGRFAVVTALGLIEYLARPAAGLAELARVLAPGGHLVVTSPNPLRLAYLADPVGVLRARLAPPKGGYRRHYLTPAQLRRGVEANDLQVLDLLGHGLGPLTLAGRPLLSDARAIAVGEWLERRLPARLVTRLGANLVALARRPA